MLHFIFIGKVDMTVTANGKTQTKRRSPSHEPIGHLVDISKAAELCGVSTKWIHKHISEATLPFPYYPVSAGKRVFDMREINQWMDSIKVAPGKFPGE
jgi:predicted DNA-binding transcriptional regulator AlpA